MVSLEVVPHEATHLIAVGTSLRKPKNILEAYLKSLAWQVKPRQVQFVYGFVDDGLEEDAKQLVQEFVQQHGGALFNSGQAVTTDFSDQGITHGWTDSAMQRVGRNKDHLLNWAREIRADGIWFCDSDLICDPMTFADLWSVPEQIVAGTYWTRWTKELPENHAPVHAGPQVWQGHPYTLSGNGMEEWELRKALIDRQLVHVYGQGACTLIRRDALMRGVSFAPVPGNTGAGLMQGEDRHFCMRAELLHIKMVASGWPDIFHVYHRPEDEQRIPEMLYRMDLHRMERRLCVGDLVSLDLRTLEPVRTQQGPMYPPTQQVRGRLGGVVVGNKKLHPEIEDAVLHMERGEERIVPVHFDLSWPFPEYRGQRRLIKVSLIDHKPYGFQPVVESEILSNPGGGWIDTTNCPPSLIEEMKEVHAA